MTKQQDFNSSLGHYRILDLAEGGCMIGGRMLADLGADVIKIERPGGSPSRIGPYYKNIREPEKSLYWYAYNINKRGITLDLNKSEARDLFIRLVKTADAVIESFQPGYLDKLGLGYSGLDKIKPGIILTSITPFGQDGPKSHYAGCDLTAWASGGYLYVCGDPDRPPVWISFPQASLHAGAEAAAGTMTALWYMRKSKGQGQHVDVSMQECTIACCFNAPEMWDMNKVEFARFSTGINIGTKGTRQNCVWKCKDGQIIFVSQGGVQPFVNSFQGLVDWMAQEGMAEDWLKKMDWAKDYDASKLTQEAIDRVEKEIARFFVTKTKKKLYEEGALNRRILIGPLSTTKDIAENTQLKSRDYWQQLEHPELTDTITYPGPFSKISDPPITLNRRAPLIGEHNREIYMDELGVSRGKMGTLQKSGVM